ncbi:DEAD/DEAH box helicase [Thalassoglobus sp.]|uniref:DEAD/DEAH box helicase n=1 Tax=Thalassoglobus sp. TaxID=2795869 RepID=UPI003AA8F207
MFPELEKTKDAFVEYIEATYHITNRNLLDRRRNLLLSEGVVTQSPFIESTARYSPADRYESLELPPSVKELFCLLASAEGDRVIFDPPYSHQAEALQSVVGAEPSNLIVTTGTGSGKTETFLLPILGRLAREAADVPNGFRQRAVRALLLYPMNALVNDQLGRLRMLFGADATREWFISKSGRPAKFGRYTSRTPFPGVVPGPNETSKLTQRFRGLRFYADLEEQASTGDAVSRRTIQELKKRGKWPAKIDPTGGDQGFTSWFGRGRWHDANGQLTRTKERVADPELLTRFEVQNAPPDLLVTNYSMLEYMMLRPIERGIFDASRDYYKDNPNEVFLLVLDEAHLYRGAQGTEVAMLIRRLRTRLGLTPDRVRVICTSASFEDPEKAKTFAAGLSGTSRDSFLCLSGNKAYTSPSGDGDIAFAKGLTSVDLASFRAETTSLRLSSLNGLFKLCKKQLREYAYNVEVPVQDTTLPGTIVKVHGISGQLEKVSEELRVPVGGKIATERKYLAITNLSANLKAVAMREDESAAITTKVQGQGETPEEMDAVSRVLFDILRQQPVVGRLINLTSGAENPNDFATQDHEGPAREVSHLAIKLFPGVDEAIAREATDRLIELASYAKERPHGTPLLAARLHRFYRGLPGMWACSDPHCSELEAHERGKAPVGRMFVQPVRTCPCGSRVFEMYSCRTCGSAFFYAWSLEPDQPKYLWHQDVGEVDEVDAAVQPVHVLLEDPGPYFDPEDGDAQSFQERYLDPVTGRLFDQETETTRPVWLPPQAIESTPGQFNKCPRCQATERGGRSQIQDLQTKGDEPFQQLIASQLLEQPPRPDINTPLKGRKSLIFSDGRQPASRLAGKLGSNSLKDSIRPLMLDGFSFLRTRWSDHLDEVQSLRFAYIALQCGAIENDVTLTPQLKGNEQSFFDHRARISSVIEIGSDWDSFKDVADQVANESPQSILQALYEVLFNKQTGVHSLALAVMVPRLSRAQEKEFKCLGVPPVSAEISEEDRRILLLTLWIRLMADKRGVFIPGTPIQWVDSNEGATITLQSGKFTTTLRPLITNAFLGSQFTGSKQQFGPWLKFLSTSLGCHANAGKFLLNGSAVGLAPPEDFEWQRCRRCSWVQPRLELAQNHCFGCGGSHTVASLDVETDEAFRKRKAFYRRLTERMHASDRGVWAPHPFVAKEHTAAIGAVDSQKSFSLAEWYEMRFQDLQVPGPVDDLGGPVDVLSCTTTMEVGIDIGSLTAVALRNVPPNRANYQQRAGRAGRRGSSLSTVITYADQGSHDQKFFDDPAAMISGPVTDPILNLDNPDIVIRHGFAFLLSLFQQERIGIAPSQNANIFSSLGLVDDFRRGSEDEFSFRGLAKWIQENSQRLNDALRDLLPQEFASNSDSSIEKIPENLLRQLERVGAGPLENAPSDSTGVATNSETISSFGNDWGSFNEQEFNDGEQKQIAPAESVQSDTAEVADAPRDVAKLLDLLFDKAVLPSYAFPTDVVSMTVFDRSSTPYRAVVKYAPQRGLSQALSSYAPGREIYIDGLRHLSFAIWTPFDRERREAWENRSLYYQCSQCGFVEVKSPNEEGRFEGEARNCPACAEPKGLGPALWWVTPPGFAHPFDLEERLVDDPPEQTRPTQAKLSAEFQQTAVPDKEINQNGRGFLKWARKEDLFITNAGSRDPQNLGFRLCTFCGRIEPSGWIADSSQLTHSTHAKPYPDHRGQDGGQVCSHRNAIKTTTLGTKFRSDVVLYQFRLGDEVRLRPGSTLARIVLGTLANAMSATVVNSLEIERSNVGGEFRPALTPGGEAGSEVDVYLYDTNAGGAGFVQAATRNATKFLERTLSLLEDCDCTHSCYKCLHTYENRFDHADLDRRIAASFLRHVLSIEEFPQLDSETEDRLLCALARDLEDSGKSVTLESGYIDILTDPKRRIVLANSLSPTRGSTERADLAIRAFSNHVVLPHLLVERALPVAVNRSLGIPDNQLVEVPTANLPVVESGGIPVFNLEGLSAGWESANELYQVNVPELNGKDAVLLQLDQPVLEQRPVKEPVGRTAKLQTVTRMKAGSMLVIQKLASISPTPKMNSHIVVLHHSHDVFRATELSSTVGYLQLRGENRLRIGYASSKKRCQPEILGMDGISALGVVRGILHQGRLITTQRDDSND